MRYQPPIYVLCVSSHFWPFTKVNFVLTILQKSWDSVRPPPPWLGQNPKFVKGNISGAPLNEPFETLPHIWWLNELSGCLILHLSGLLYWLTVKLFSTGSTNLFQEASILFQHIILEVIVLFVELRPFSPHIYALFCRILSRQTFTRFL